MSTHHLGYDVWSTPAMRDIFGDDAVLRHALAFERGLAAAEADAGLITHAAAEAIAAACSRVAIDPAELAREAALAGTLAIPLVARLRTVLAENVEAASGLHRGATSQDLADTVLMLLVREAREALETDQARLAAALRATALAHANRPSVGRTLLQDALPVGFGLRLAQALRGIELAWHHLDAAVSTEAKLQFGGAAGTRAGLDGQGDAIAAGLARALALPDAPPWHAQRTGTALIASGLGLLIGAVGKFARDVSLLAQNRIGESQEPRIAGRGGSSAMAHKRNPTGCQLALSAAVRAPGLVATIFGGLPQEWERGLGGWQAEAPVIAELFLLASGSLSAMAVVAEGLDIDESRIEANLQDAAIGTDIGESAIITASLVKD